MAVIRVEKNSNYTVMANHHLRDDLSLKAKGLMSVMLSLPDNWDYSVAGLTAISQESKPTINKCLKELESKGYLVRKQKRNENNNQFAEIEYILYENPCTKNVYTENFPQLNTKQLNTNKLNTNNIYAEKKKETKHKYGEFGKVKLTDEQYKKMQTDYPNHYQTLIKKLDEYKESSGRIYKNDYLVMTKEDSWVKREVMKNQANATFTWDKPVVKRDERNKEDNAKLQELIKGIKGE